MKNVKKTLMMSVAVLMVMGVGNLFGEGKVTIVNNSTHLLHNVTVHRNSGNDQLVGYLSPTGTMGPGNIGPINQQEIKVSEGAFGGYDAVIGVTAMAFPETGPKLIQYKTPITQQVQKHGYVKKLQHGMANGTITINNNLSITPSGRIYAL